MRPQDDKITLSDRHRDLLEAISSGKAVPAGRLLGLPDLPDHDVWVDTAGAAALAKVNPKTITGWLARKGPRRRPFPEAQHFLYRLYWRRSQIEQWLVAQGDLLVDQVHSPEMTGK